MHWSVVGDYLNAMCPNNVIVYPIAIITHLLACHQSFLTCHLYLKKRYKQTVFHHPLPQRTKECDMELPSLYLSSSPFACTLFS